MSMNLQCESKYIKMMGRLKATSLCLVPISISISIGNKISFGVTVFCSLYLETNNIIVTHFLHNVQPVHESLIIKLAVC